MNFEPKNRKIIVRISAETRVYGETDEEVEDEKVKKKRGVLSHTEEAKLITEIKTLAGNRLRNRILSFGDLGFVRIGFSGVIFGSKTRA